MADQTDPIAPQAVRLTPAELAGSSRRAALLLLALLEDDQVAQRAALEDVRAVPRGLDLLAGSLCGLFADLCPDIRTAEGIAHLHTYIEACAGHEADLAVAAS